MWSLALLSFYFAFAIEMTDVVIAVVNNSQTITSRRNTFRSLSIDDHSYFDHIDWKDVIESLMNIDCQSDHMQINFRYNTRHARLLGRKLRKLTSRLSMKSISLNANSNNNNSETMKNITECDSTRDDVHSQLTLKVDYCDGCCGMRIDRLSPNWTAHHISVALSMDDQTVEEFQIKKFVTQVYDFSCSVLSNVNQDTLGPVVINLSKDARGVNLYHDHERIDADEKIFLQGVFPVLSSSNDVRSLIDLKSFPLNCYLKDEQRIDTSVVQQRRFFLRNGCPGRDHRSHGLSTVHHFINGDTRIGFQMVEYLTEFFADKRNASFSINCEIMACSYSRLHGLYGVSKCPLTTYCSLTTDIGSPGFPVNRNVVYNVKSRLLNGNVEDLSNSPPQRDSPPNFLSVNNNRLNVKCRQTCPPIIAKKLNVAHVQYNDEDNEARGRSSKEHQAVSSTNVHYVPGVSTKTAILLALVSFLAGALVTTLIWYLHRKETANAANAKVYEMSSVNQSRHQLILPQSFRLSTDSATHDSAEVSMIDSSR